MLDRELSLRQNSISKWNSAFLANECMITKLYFFTQGTADSLVPNPQSPLGEESGDIGTVSWLGVAH